MDPKAAEHLKPAFPTLAVAGDVALSEGGITMRDYFAAKALQGFCANPAVFASNGMSGWDLVNCTEDQLAEVCNRLADAMLRAREQS
jgi:hypothetical protein